METAALCDPDTPRLASWRQQPPLSSACTEAYKVNKCSFWVVRPITLTEGNDATGLLLLETWDLPLVVPYGAFERHGNAFKI